jgi:hypothetical protein
VTDSFHLFADFLVELLPESLNLKPFSFNFRLFLS